MQNPFTQDLERSPYEQIGVMPAVEGSMICNLCYPEVYYKIQPFVMTTCDQIDTHNRAMISQEMFDQMSDGIYTNVCMMYPDLAEYANCQDMSSYVETERFRDFDRGRRFFPRRRFRRRGLFRDFIELLLLNELFRRGRFFW
ncbi:MAG: hypothetical protein AAGU75_13265 [Bacillota bacterium]